VIVHLGAGATIAELEASRDRYVRALAWAPTGEFVAVLTMSLESRFDIRNFPAAVAGHPVRYQMYHLEIYERDGKQVIAAPVARNLLASSGEVVWIP
jgi:hypothetical protein